MHPPEGGPSEGTGHGPGRATGGTGLRPFGYPAKRWRPLARPVLAAGWCVADRRRFDRALTLRDPDSGWRWATSARDLPRGRSQDRPRPTAGRRQARDPPSTGGSSRWCRNAAALFGARGRGRQTSSPPGNPAIEPSAAGRQRSVGGWREADARGPGGRFPARESARLSVGCGRFAAHPSSRPGSRVDSSADFGVAVAHRGRGGHCRQTAHQDCWCAAAMAGARIVDCRIFTDPSEASGAPG